MPNKSSPQSKERQNGHRTVGPSASGAPSGHEEMEPKGLPNSDRYHSETVHTAETDDQTKIAKQHRQK